MKSRGLLLYLGPVLVLLVAVLVIGPMLVKDASKRLTLAKYHAIKSGMTPVEVQRLMNEAGDVTFSQLGNAEVFHINGRFLVGVVYEPNPNLPGPATNFVVDRPRDDWVVRRKMIYELERNGQIDALLIKLRLRTPRIVESDRVSRPNPSAAAAPPAERTP